ncbi:MAG: NUDIX hydrolase [Coprobacter sp.]|nr:NUDIX hydrolase [Coprobacter sp.]
MTSHPFYEGQARFLVSVDCVILGFIGNEIKLLTFHRKIEPNVGGLSLLGGFVYENETIDAAAMRVLSDLTGLDNVYMNQVGAYGRLDRDPGERVISVAYYALIRIDDTLNSVISASDSQWVNLDRTGELIFDHKQMVDDALAQLRRQAALYPVGFNLLPERFTLTQLQSLYESIYAEKFDKRNFRKKMLSMGILERLEEKDREHSKRGAYYFVFNKEKYEELVRKGSGFSI